MKKKERERQRIRRERMPNVNDPTLAAMNELAYTEYRVRIGLMVIREMKIWAHDEKDAVNKVKKGAGTLASKSEPEVVSVQVGKPGGAVTQTQAESQARVIENAQAQKNPNMTMIGDTVKK